jgi:hypothetical protein
VEDQEEEEVVVVAGDGDLPAPLSRGDSFHTKRITARPANFGFCFAVMILLA